MEANATSGGVPTPPTSGNDLPVMTHSRATVRAPEEAQSTDACWDTEEQPALSRFPQTSGVEITHKSQVR